METKYKSLLLLHFEELEYNMVQNLLLTTKQLLLELFKYKKELTNISAEVSEIRKISLYDKAIYNSPIFKNNKPHITLETICKITEPYLERLDRLVKEWGRYLYLNEDTFQELNHKPTKMLVDYFSIFFEEGPCVRINLSKSTSTYIKNVINFVRNQEDSYTVKLFKTQDLSLFIKQ